MNRHYSVAAARSGFAQLIREVESGEAVEITRRGRPVAVVVSLGEYRRRGSSSAGVGKAIEAWRRDNAPDKAGIDRKFIESLRDRSRGRKVDL